MNENEFNTQADEVFQRIESALDSCDGDIDYDSNGMVMEIEFADGSKLIINRHLPNREIWLAARSGGFHFSLKDGRWFSQRDDIELYDTLKSLVETGAGVKIDF